MFACRNYVKTLLRQSGRTNNPRSWVHGRWLHKTTVYCCKDKKDPDEEDLAGSVSTKYEIFVDDKSPIIFDIEQEREKFYEVNDESEQPVKKKDTFYGISPTRGKEGVIDIDELVTILDREKALDIVVLKIPEEYAYVDYFVILSTRSWKHMDAIAEYIRRVYKYKTNSTPNLPDIEGKNSRDWKALDLGNIALHIMSKSARDLYDLESLWSTGSEYDPKSNTLDEIKDYSYASLLSELRPASET